MNLTDYYKQRCDLQGHNKEVHKEIRRLLKECDTYEELDVMEGSALAAVLLENPTSIQAVGNLETYNKVKHYFEDYAKENNILFEVFDADPTNCRLNPADLLLIGGCCTVDQLTQTLNLHGPTAQKYIILRNTTLFPELKQVAINYGKKTNRWVFTNEGTDLAGFISLQQFSR